MQYRPFGNTGVEVSALGFGAMRLPTTDPDDYASIDHAQATRLVRYAIDHGVNYVDSCYHYHANESERFLGRALQDGYREKVYVATKLPAWIVEEHEGDADTVLNEQLERLQTDYIDFYLFHGLNRERWKTVERYSLLAWAEGALADGRICHLGFSFHDEFDIFKTIVDAYDGWEFCQVQYNYMDVNTQAGRKGVEYAASQGLGIVVMEPLLGGRLVNPPQTVQEIWDTAPSVQTPVERALRWLWDQPEISVVLSGMSAMEHVVENVAHASTYGVGNMSDEDQALIAQVRDEYEDLCPIPCTKCGYCLPCTVELNIPWLFDVLNQGVMYDRIEEARERYRHLDEGKRAASCTACKECEQMCPQSIPISAWMERVEQILGQGVEIGDTGLPLMSAQ